MKKLLQTNLTAEDRKPPIAMVTKNIQALAAQSFAQLARHQKRLMVLTWENPNYSAEEILKELGADAVELVQFQNALQAAVNSIDAESTTKVAEGVSVEVASDSVTVSNHLDAEGQPKKLQRGRVLSPVVSARPQLRRSRAAKNEG